MTSMQSGAHCRSTVTLTALVVAGACIFSGCATSAQPKPPAPVNLGDNAALKYWIAFGEMPNLSPEERKLLEKWNTVPMDEATIAVIGRSTACLNALHEAAQVRPCNWGFTKGHPNAPRPQYIMAGQAAGLACLSAWYLAGRSGSQGAIAVSHLLAVFALARQINSDSDSFGFIVQANIERMATNATARCLTQLTPAQLRQLAAGLDALAARQGYREAVLSGLADAKYEIDFFNAMDDSMKKNELKFKSVQMIGEDVMAGDEASRAPWENDLERGLTPEDLREYTRGFDKVPEYYNALAELGSLPLPEFEWQVAVLQEKMKTVCPYAARFTSFKSLPMQRYREAKSEVRIAMLKAAIAVILGGPDRIKEFKDPYGDGPFGYSKVGEGFELKSKFIFAGREEQRPATLSVSAPP
jgi:hypothetical protein